MKRPSKKKTMGRMQRVLDEIYELETSTDDSPEFLRWYRNAQVTIKKTFGDQSGQIEDFLECFHLADYHSDALERAGAILDSMLDEIDEYWDDDSQTSTFAPRHIISNPDTKKVFVIHGRDKGTREMVAGFLKKLELQPVILSEQSSRGRTIIEKFEQHAEVGFAIALLTPDDTGSLEGDKKRPRARQNVIFELGFFIGKLGRERVCALTKGDVEIPSEGITKNA